MIPDGYRPMTAEEFNSWMRVEGEIADAECVRYRTEYSEFGWWLAVRC